MQRVLLEVCAGIVALLFLTSFASMATHHARCRRQGVVHVVSVAEYLWALVPWVMVAAAAFPAVWPILAAP
jgi:hypothetical protein